MPTRIEINQALIECVENLQHIQGMIGTGYGGSNMLHHMLDASISALHAAVMLHKGMLPHVYRRAEEPNK